MPQTVRFHARCHSVQNIFCSSLLSENIKIKICRTIILSVVLYGCETWSLTLGEGSRLSVFENRALRGIFGPKRDEVTGEWRKVHNEELNDLYCCMICTAVWSVQLTKHYLGDQIKCNEMGWACSAYREGQRSILGFGEKSWRKETTRKTQA